MINAIELENFKAVGERQRLELRPVTLIFGPNSAGKSTLLQSMLYLHEVLSTGEVDLNRTVSGGTSMQLGGFGRIVHQHDRSKKARIRVEFSVPGTLNRHLDMPENFPWQDVDDDVNSAWIELVIGQGPLSAPYAPRVEQVIFGLHQIEQPVAWCSVPPSTSEEEHILLSLNMDHNMFIETDWDDVEPWLPFQSSHQSYDLSVYRPESASSVKEVRVFALKRGKGGALPDLDGPIKLAAEETASDNQQAWQNLRLLLDMLVNGTLSRLKEGLGSLLYVGPLRTIPSPDHLYEKPGRVSAWADGLAAWDTLLTSPPSLLQDTNEWLRKLGAGCSIVEQRLVDPAVSPEEAAGNPAWSTRRLVLESNGVRVLPSELGAGISQIVPIIVASLVNSRGIRVFEQPELHVHPALQVGIGDLLSEPGLGWEGRRAIVETHSEHIILRLLRRIRENAQVQRSPGEFPFASHSLSVLYVERLAEGMTVKNLRVDEQGEFLDEWPRGFFEERDEELF